jgi:type IV pilus assembly protein PilA
MKKQQGFTLIELMIVVAIIAILAAIALPAYQDYVARSQVSEAMTLSSGIKTAAAEYYADRGTFSGTHAELGIAPAGSITGKYVRQVAYTGTATNGTITATMKSAGSASGKIAGRTFILVATDNNGSITWTCNTGNIDDKYLPSSCR